MKKFVMAFTLLAFLLSSCKKSSTNNTACTLSGAALAGSWAFTSATYKRTPSSPSVDIYHDNNWFYACERDDYTTFNANGTYTYVDAGVQCTPVGTVNGTWTLTGNVLNTSNANWVKAANPISNFDCNQMVFTYNSYDTTGDQAIITYIKR